MSSEKPFTPKPKEINEKETKQFLKNENKGLDLNVGSFARFLPFIGSAIEQEKIQKGESDIEKQLGVKLPRCKKVAINL